MSLFLNQSNRYSFLTIFLHWLTALTIPALFAVGWWMVELDYYSEWYRTAPEYHKGVGVLLLLALAVRLAIRQASARVRPAAGTRPIEARIAHWVHLAFYGLIAITCVCGYLISTADGRPVNVFGWFEIPATITSIPDQEDLMGEVHLVLASSILGLAALHALAALKHHFLSKDATLKRMLGSRG